jgi:hypothetical protein
MARRAMQSIFSTHHRPFMTHRTHLCIALLSLASWAHAAPPKTMFVDHSSAALMDKATAKAIMAEGFTPKVLKVYPANKFGFVSQVEGGITGNGTCVVTARVMMMQLTPTVKAMLFRPEETATTFEAQPGASADQCKQLAKTKLQEAVKSVASSLVKTKG